MVADGNPLPQYHPRTSEPWKRFVDPDSEKELVYWSENKKFSDFYEKTVDS